MSTRTSLDIAKSIVSNYEPEFPEGSRYIYTFTGTAQLFLHLNEELLLSDWHYDYDPSNTQEVCYFGIGAMRNRSLRHQGDSKRKIKPPSSNRLPLRYGLSDHDVFTLETILVARFGKLFHGGILTNESDGGAGCSNRIMAQTYFSDHEDTLLANASWYYLIDQDKNILDHGTANGLANTYGVDQGAVAGIARGKSGGAWHEPTRTRLIFCLVDDYESFQVQPCDRLREMLVIAPDGSTDIGLGRELRSKYGLHHLHRTAGQHSSTVSDKGFQCFYVDAL